MACAPCSQLPGGLGRREGLDVALELGRRDGAAESAAREPSHHRARPGVAGLALGEASQATLQLGARVGGSEQLIAVGPQFARAVADVGRGVEPSHRQGMLAGGQPHLGVDLLSAAAGGLKLERLRADDLAIDDEVHVGGRVALVTDGNQVGTEEVFAVARGLELGRQGRRVEDPHLILAAAAREHLITIDVEHIEVLGRGRHGLVGDELGRGHETLEVDRREREHVADIVETIARVVAREVRREIALEVAKVADGIVVLGPVEPPDRHGTRVDLGLGDGLAEQPADADVEGRDLGRDGPLLAGGGRHLAGDHLVDDLAPEALVLVEAGVVLEGLEVQVPLGLVRVVAIVAVFLQDRLDVLAEILRPGGGAKPDQDGESDEAGPQSPEASGQACPHGIHQDRFGSVKLQLPGVNLWANQLNRV